MAREPQVALSGPVLLYDGECGLCNRLVRAMLRMDRRGILRFTPLQGPSARQYLAAHGFSTESFSTVIFVPDWAHWQQRDFRAHSDGVIAALRCLGGWGSALAAFVAGFPRPVRDGVYRAIGHWRYRVFGPWKPRPLPRPEWKRRFF